MANIVKRQTTDIAQLTPHEMQLCQILNRYNKLRQFKLDAIEILEWKDDILLVMPDLELEKLDFAITKMMTEEIEFNDKIGIQNIFRALRYVHKTENGFEVLKNCY